MDTKTKKRKHSTIAMPVLVGPRGGSFSLQLDKTTKLYKKVYRRVKSVPKDEQTTHVESVI